MHNGLSIYQTKYCETTFLALPCLSYILLNRPVVGKTALLHQKSQQTHYYYRVATVEFVLAPQHETSCDPETTTKEDFDYLRKTN